MNKVLIGKGLKPQGPNLCVLNVMRSLLEDKDSVVYIPQDYVLGSVRDKYDSKVHKNPSEAGKPIVVTAIQSHAERYNFSLTGTVDVMVEEDAADGTVNLVPKKIFRTYNIIRDGKLTIDYLVCKLSKESFEDMKEAGILYYNGIKVPMTHNHNPEFLYKVVLNTIPLISLNWAQPFQIGLYKYLIEELELSDLQTRLNAQIKKFKEQGQTLTSTSNSDYYFEKEDTEYNNINVKTYEASCVVYRLKGKKPHKMSEEVFNEVYKDLFSATMALKEVKQRLRDIRFVYRCIIWAIENSAKRGSYNWSSLEPVPRSKNKYSQIAHVEYEDETLTLERLVYTKEVKANDVE